jgi:hypothetical protein
MLRGKPGVVAEQRATPVAKLAPQGSAQKQSVEVHAWEDFDKPIWGAGLDFQKRCCKTEYDCSNSKKTAENCHISLESEEHQEYLYHRDQIWDDALLLAWLEGQLERLRCWILVSAKCSQEK